MNRTKATTTKYRIMLIAIAFIMAAGTFVMPSGAFAAGSATSEDQPQLDYIKGRPLTEEELKEQLELARDPEGPLPQTEVTDTEVELVNQSDESNIVLEQTGYYDSRNEPWYQYVKVDDQGRTDLCWAYAMTTVMEMAYAKNTGGRNKHLSATHLGYFFFHRANDPLGKTKKDKNDVYGSHWYEIGGSSELTIQALAGWIGAASESKIPEKTIKLDKYSVKSSFCYKDSVQLKNAKFLDDTDEIKQAILKNGAVEAAINIDSGVRYYNPQTASRYVYDSKPVNHEIALIGWDDNYSRENFNEGHQPDHDGAWIVQNSWGPEWGKGGCFYMSYEDVPFLSNGNALAVDVQPAGTYKYNYQYDGNSSPMSFTLYEGEKVGNIFKVPGPSVGRSQFLKAVGITTWKKNSKFRIDIYRNLTSRTRPTKGEKVCTKYVTTNYPGYYTIKLPKTVRLKTGSYYSIVVTSRNGAKFGIEKNYKILAGDSGINFVSGNLSKRSFAYLDGSWADMYTAKQSARIKGFTTLSACIKNIAVKSKGRKYVKLRWDKMDGYRGYAVYRKVNGSYKLVVKYRGTDYNAYKVRNLKPGKTYRFRVRAYKIIKGVTYYSGASKTITVKTKN